MGRYSNGAERDALAVLTSHSHWRAQMSSMQTQAPILVTTTERPAGYEVKQALGQVFGVVVRSRGLGGNIVAGLRALGGGEIVWNTRLAEDHPRHALHRVLRS